MSADFGYAMPNGPQKDLPYFLSRWIWSSKSSNNQGSARNHWLRAHRFKRRQSCLAAECHSKYFVTGATDWIFLYYSEKSCCTVPDWTMSDPSLLPYFHTHTYLYIYSAFARRGTYEKTVSRRPSGTGEANWDELGADRSVYR